MPAWFTRRLLVEAGFLFLVAFALGTAQVRPWWAIVLVMGLAWLAVAFVEWSASRAGRVAEPAEAEPEPADEEPPRSGPDPEALARFRLKLEQAAREAAAAREAEEPSSAGVVEPRVPETADAAVPAPADPVATPTTVEAEPVPTAGVAVEDAPVGSDGAERVDAPPAPAPVVPDAEAVVPPAEEPVPAASGGARSVTAPVVTSAAAPRRWNLWHLERLARDRAGRDPARDEEWSFLFMHLREFADPDGVLPADFDGLVRDAFGELISADDAA